MSASPTYDSSRRRRTLSGVEIAGRLTERVQLFRVELVDDGHGGHVETPVPLVPFETFAHVEAMQGSERLQALALEVALLYLVTLRYRADVTAGTRITWGSHVLEVHGPPVELLRRQLLQCYCSERGV